MAIMAVSCVQEQLAVYDETKITAPVLGTYNVAEDVITANYTPAKMELGFNENIAPSHTLAVVSLNGEPQSKSLTTTNDGATLTLKTVNLAKALITLGAKEGSNANVELAVRATLQDVAKDNGVNGCYTRAGWQPVRRVHRGQPLEPHRCHGRLRNQLGRRPEHVGYRRR